VIKKEIILGLLFFSLVAASCSSSATENPERKVTPEHIDDERNEKVTNADSLVQVIDSRRSQIESLSTEPIEISTASLRSTLKQKWSKILFYLEGSELVKIKTYPYPGISERTEEFYIDNSKLIFVEIEDNGSVEKGKSKAKRNSRL